MFNWTTVRWGLYTFKHSQVLWLLQSYSIRDLFLFGMKLMQLEGKLSITGEKINSIPPKNRIMNQWGREKGFPPMPNSQWYLGWPYMPSLAHIVYDKEPGGHWF